VSGEASSASRLARFLEELAEQSARASEVLLAEQLGRQAALEELAERQAAALAELHSREG